MTILIILGGWILASILAAALFSWRVKAGRTPEWYR